jgi:pentatricopeptide repeat protein
MLMPPDSVSPGQSLNSMDLEGCWQRVQKILAHRPSWRQRARVMLKDLVGRGLCSESHMVLGMLQQTDTEMVDIVCINIVMSSYKRLGLFAQALHLMHQSFQVGMCPDTVTFNIAIDSCGKAGMLESAFAHYDEMHKYGCAPTVSTYTCLIDACGKNKDLARAISLLNQMEAEGIRPNACTFTALVQACCEVSELGHGTVVLERLVHQSWGAPLDLRATYACTTPFHTLIRACFETLNADLAVYALSLMLDMPLPPKRPIAILTLETCFVTGRTDLVVRTWSLLAKQKCAAKGFNDVLQASIEVCASLSALEHAHDLLLLFHSRGWGGAIVDVSPVSCKRLFEDAVRAEFVELAEQLIPLMEKNGTLLMVSYNTVCELIEACACHLGDVARAVVILGKFRHVTDIPLRVYVSLLSCQRSHNLMNIMRTYGVPRPQDELTCSTFMEGCIEACAFSEATAFLRFLTRKKIPLTIDVGQRLLDRCLACRDFRAHCRLTEALNALSQTCREDLREKCRTSSPIQVSSDDEKVSPVSTIPDSTLLSPATHHGVRPISLRDTDGPTNGAPPEPYAAPTAPRNVDTLDSEASTVAENVVKDAIALSMMLIDIVFEDGRNPSPEGSSPSKWWSEA